ncbi:hypothetical protein C2S53_000808 [Perilla frutescens var. hirtella]|uniref:Uncharacterized protein n=1 Tax=Perilla frutescens var. hirtella TaxID=608512 RepID=A0AAD4IPI5_PERFH|nr:hypothetical protein C2S53_000808 [Perilla frutescens var. hirtella]
MGQNGEPAKMEEQDQKKEGSATATTKPSPQRKNKIIPMSPRGARFKEEFLSKILPWEKLTASLDNFPQYIEENTKTLLMECVASHLKQKKLRKNRGHFTSSSERILLQSIPGYGALPREIGEYTCAGVAGSIDEARQQRFTSIWDRVMYFGKTISIEEANNRTLSFGQRGEVYEVKGEKVAVVFNICGLKTTRTQKDEGNTETLRQALVTWLDVKNVKQDLDAQTHDYHIGMEVLYEVLESQPPMIVYFPDSFLWPSTPFNTRKGFPDPFIFQSVPYDIHKQLPGKMKESFDQLPEDVVMICAQNKSEPRSEEMEKFPEFLKKDIEKLQGPWGYQVSEMQKLFTNVVCIKPPKLLFPSMNISSLRPQSELRHSSPEDLLMHKQNIKDQDHLNAFNKQIEEDRLAVISEGNLSIMHKVLKAHNLACMDLENANVEDMILTRENVEKIIGWATSHYLSSCPLPHVNKEKLHIPNESIKLAIMRFKEEEETQSKKQSKSIEHLATGRHEISLVSAVVRSEDIGVKFDDVGALENVKKVLHETVILPMRRPELFSHGNLLRRPVSRLIHLWIILCLAPSSCSYARKGCPDRCGSLLIPYPFGVGPGCYIERSFKIICDSATNPPRAYLPYPPNAKILDINLTFIRVRMPNRTVVYNLYDPVLGRVFSAKFLGFIDTPYIFSDGNWLTSISCDDVASMTGRTYDGVKYSGGCLSQCDGKNDFDGILSCPDIRDSGYGQGSGCCRAPIPRDTTILFSNLTDVCTIWNGRTARLFHNGFAFIGEKLSFNQSYNLTALNRKRFLSDKWQAKNAPPLLLEWRITGAKNCSQARKLTNYTCQENSHCVDFQVDFHDVSGYRCNCSKGYVGNPYLAPGCRDIDECADRTVNPCGSNAICTNTQGGFTCSCRKGYRDNGLGCLRHSWPKSKIINIIIGLGTGVGFMLVIAICVVLWKALHKRMERKKKEKFFEHLLVQHQTSEGGPRTKLFTAKELDKATDNFNSSRIIGEGGHGTVYKGMMSDGRIVAVKKLKTVSENEVDQLINEIVILSQINHRNVVKLLGCCLATKMPMLVYEFILNGTLSQHLRDPNSSLEWKTRLKMAVELADPLAYLHSGSSIPIFHRDIKSSNILLDENFIAKLADFGISKIVALDQTHISTKPQGTFGYLDPEYFMCGQLTEKSDVYSFRVVLVELLTGEKAISEDRGLASRFQEWMDNNILETVLDAQLSGEGGGKEEMFAFASIAERCLNTEGKMRPQMREVVAELEKISRMRDTAQMASTSTSRALVTKPYLPMKRDLSDISEISDTDLKLAILRVKKQHLPSSSKEQPTKNIKDLAKDKYEKRLVSAVACAQDIGVKFDDVGALEYVKKTLYETVILPLRPELFSHGNFEKGILLFGPPGTGKTLMAKVLATEAWANFINATAAVLTSEADSVFAACGQNHWDTSLPDAENCSKILNVLLREEHLELGFSVEQLTKATESYSGGDFKGENGAPILRPLDIDDYLHSKRTEKTILIQGEAYKEYQVVCARDIGVKFDEFGALENVKIEDII